MIQLLSKSSVLTSYDPYDDQDNMLVLRVQ